MKTNKQQHPKKASLKYLRVSNYTLLIIALAAVLATAGAALSQWPDEKESQHGTPINSAQRNRNQIFAEPESRVKSAADSRTIPSPVESAVSMQGNTSTRDRGRLRCYLPNTSGFPKIYTVRDEDPIASPSPILPKEGSELNSKQFAELMSGRIAFSPQDIGPSGKNVDDSTPLKVGQEVLLRWEKTWWAATVTGFEPDGAIRVTYFGWPRCWDEAVPRSDLQLDTNTREKAIQTVYFYSP